MNNRITAKIALLVSAFLASSIAHAEEGIIPKLIEYDVDVIIFEDAHARYINSEYWHKDTDKTLPMNAAETNNDSFKKDNFKTIKPALLRQEYRRINNSSEYNVLFYGSWRQTGLDENKTFDIDIEELNNIHKTTSKSTLTGNFKLVLARYLHIYADLEYERNQKSESTDQSTSNTQSIQPDMENGANITSLANRPYPIDIHRRMRSKELHYIDHPLVGMLIQINPVVTNETSQ